MIKDRVCPFPGCNKELTYTDVCGEHQETFSKFVRIIKFLCEQQGYAVEKHSLHNITLELTPHVFEQCEVKPKRKPRIKTGLTPLEFRLMTHVSKRTIFSILSNKHLPSVYVDNKRLVNTSDAILFYVCGSELIPLREAARRANVSHRSLRHLVHETKKLSGMIFPYGYSPAGPKTVYFWPSELAKIERCFK